MNRPMKLEFKHAIIAACAAVLLVIASCSGKANYEDGIEELTIVLPVQGNSWVIDEL